MAITHSSARRDSRRLDPCDAIDRVGDVPRRLALGLEHLLAGGGQAIVAAAALPAFLDPAPLNPAARLEAIEQRVERGDAEFEDAARARFDQLAEVVAVPRLILDEREDQQLRAPFLQLAVEDPRLDVLHSDILLKRIRGVNLKLVSWRIGELPY